MSWRASVANWSARTDRTIEQWLGWQLPPAQAVVAESGWNAESAESGCARCGASVGAGEQDERGCARCRSRRLPYQALVRLGPYLPPLSSWIAAIKYRQWAEMGQLLGERLGETLLARGLIEPARTVLIPMPMPWQRRLYRGIDHAAVIAQAVAVRSNALMVQMLAKRNGSPQVALTLDQRARNLRGRFRLRRRPGGWPMRDLDLVLVDDVTTSGASLRTAARLLRTLRPRRLIVAVLAVTDEKSRRMRVSTESTLDPDARRNDDAVSSPLIEPKPDALSSSPHTSLNASNPAIGCSAPSAS
jgi:predicted amidophosphoribosyltransferase